MLLSALVVSCACAQAMDLRDMPDWVRECIRPVDIDWRAMADAPVGDPTGAHLRAPGPAGSSAPLAVPAAPRATAPGATGITVAAPSGWVPDGGVTVAAPASGMRGGVHARGVGFDVGGATGARLKSPAEFAGIGGVHVRQMGAEWDEALARIQRLSCETLARAGHILAMIREQNMSPEKFAGWVKARETTPAILTAGLLMVGVHRHDNYPTPQPHALVLASGLEALWGDGLSRVIAVPPFGRLWLAILRGTRGDDAGALTAFDSMSDEQLAALPHETSVMAIAHLMRDVPRMSVAAIKRYAIATDQRAMWCFDLYLSCTQVDDPELVRAELIPWLEDALRESQSGVEWGRSLRNLIWAYGYVGETQAQIERGQYWLQEADARQVSPSALVKARIAVASCLADAGEYGAAIGLLRAGLPQLASSSMPAAERMQAALLQMASAEGERVQPLLPPRLTRVIPAQLRVEVRAGDAAAREIVVVGSSSFRIDGVNCEVPGVTGSVGSHSFTELGEVVCRVQVAISPRVEVGVFEGVLHIESNGPAEPALRVPLQLAVAQPVAVRPRELFFGFLKPGETKTIKVRLSSERAFAVTRAECDYHADVRVELAKRKRASCVANVTVGAPQRPCTIKGSVRFHTDLDTQAVVEVPFYARVDLRR